MSQDGYCYSYTNSYTEYTAFFLAQSINMMFMIGHKNLIKKLASELFLAFAKSVTKAFPIFMTKLPMLSGASMTKLASSSPYLYFIDIMS